jgi:hypothetical protein
MDEEEMEDCLTWAPLKRSDERQVREITANRLVRFVLDLPTGSPPASEAVERVIVF